MSRLLLIVCATFMVVASPPAAAAPLRYTTVLEEEGASAVVEAALTAKMIHEGATFVDEEQSRKIRSVTNAGELIRGTVQPVITTLDADVIIAGIVRSAPVPTTALLRGKAFRHDVSVEARLVAVDTAQIVDSILIHETGADTNQRGAREAALRRAGEALAARVLESTASKSVSRRIELSVEGLDVAGVEDLQSGLRALPGIVSADVVHASKEATKLVLALQPSAPDTGELARAIAATEELQLEVTAYAAKSIKAKHASGSRAQAKHASAVLIRGVEAHDLFPARVGAYTREGIGTLVVENRSPSKATHGVVRVMLEGMMSAPAEREAPDLAPRSTARIPIPFGADGERFVHHESSTPARLEVELTYEVGGHRHTERRTASVQILDKSALDWRDAASIGGFITARVPPVHALADAALAAIPREAKSEPLSKPAALFRLLSGLSYQRDAVHPGRSNELDDIQYPVETLARGRGDCDDLAVLYAALAEAAGVRALLVLTPGHVLAALDTELPAQSARRLGMDADRAIAFAGRAWVPVETTRAGRPFAEAWKDGAAALAQLRKDGLEPVLLDVRAAWNRYPPARFEPAHAATPAVPSFAGLAEEIAALTAARAAELQAGLQQLDAKAKSGRASAAELDARAQLLAAIGRAEEARRALEEAIAHHPRAAGLENNLGNVRLILGDPSAAQEAYAKALRLTAQDRDAKIRIHLNAAVAARIAGAQDAFSDHIADSLDLATNAAAKKIVTDFLESLGGGGFVQGAEAAALDKTALAARLRELIDKRPSPIRAEGRGEGVQIGIAEIVFWLSPQ